MAIEFNLPDIGEGVTEGEIVKWLVKEGDTVAEDQAIVEVMTDKATVEIPSPYAGKVTKVYGKEGDVVPVGKPLVQIEESAEGAKVAPTPQVESKVDQPAVAAAPPPPPPTMAPSAAQGSSTSGGAPTSRILASPATRRMAREQGVDLSAVAGSGPLGRVTKADLLSHNVGATQAGSAVAAPVSYAPPVPPKQRAEFGKHEGPLPQGGEERKPLRGVRKKIAEHMALSKQKAAHFTHVDEVDMTEIVDLREKSKASAASRGVKLTYLPFVIKAICAALREYPSLNATLDEEKGEIVFKYFYNIGVAVATKDGDLIVPVIKDADQKSFTELATEIQQLAEKARTGKLALDDLKGGTFTLTSTGNLGGLMATPIINYPEVGIMGFHKIVPRPMVRNNQIVIRQMANLSLSLDHRVVDGAVGASFMNAVLRYLEDPKLFLLDI